MKVLIMSLLLLCSCAQDFSFDGGDMHMYPLSGGGELVQSRNGSVTRMLYFDKNSILYRADTLSK